MTKTKRFTTEEDVEWEAVAVPVRDSIAKEI